MTELLLTRADARRIVADALADGSVTSATLLALPYDRACEKLVELDGCPAFVAAELFAFGHGAYGFVNQSVGKRELVVVVATGGGWADGLWNRAAWVVLHEVGHAERHVADGWARFAADYPVNKRAHERDAWLRGVARAARLGLPTMAPSVLNYANRCLSTYGARPLTRESVSAVRASAIQRIDDHGTVLT